jgi:hypothetical protein
MYIRKQISGGREYYQIVEGNLIDGKVIQKVLLHIGDKEKLEKLYKNIGKRLNNQQKSE